MQDHRMKMSENKQLQQQKVIGHNFIETVSINNSVQRGDDAGRDTGVKKKTNKKIKRFDENYKGSNKWLTALMESNRQ